MTRFVRTLGIVIVALVPFFSARSVVNGSVHVSPRYAVVIVLDGARANYVSLGSLPNLHRLMARGVTYSRAFVGQEIANTPVSHATIGTGEFPKHHNVQGFMWKDPNTERMIRPTDLSAVLHGDLEAILRRSGVPSLAGAVKSTDRSARVVAVSGHKCYAADAMGAQSADYILCAAIYHDRWVATAVPGHLPPPGAVNNPKFDVPIPSRGAGFAPAVQQWPLTVENDWVVKYALWAFHRIRFPRVLMLNLPETDVTGHFSSIGGQVEQRLMANFDHELGVIEDAYRSAGLLQRTVFIVTADHGMSSIRDRLPFSVLDRAIVHAGARKVYLEGDTAAAIGIAELGKARRVALNVARDPQGQGLIDASYYRVQTSHGWRYLPAFERPSLTIWMRRAYRMMVSTAASASGPEVLVIYAPHVTTGDRRVLSYHWIGGHLGPQWDDQHIPLIIAGPGFRHGVRSVYPARLVDLAPTLERALRAPVLHVDGAPLEDAFQHPNPRALARMCAVRQYLDPLVRALQERTVNALP